MRKINAGGRGEVIITKKENGRVEVEGNLCGSAAHTQIRKEVETNSSMYGLVVWMMVSQDPGDHRILLATKISQVHANLDDFLTTKLGLIILHSTTYDVYSAICTVLCALPFSVRRSQRAGTLLSLMRPPCLQQGGFFFFIFKKN